MADLGDKTLLLDEHGMGELSVAAGSSYKEELSILLGLLRGRQYAFV
jgi:hypothetical protein